MRKLLLKLFQDLAPVLAGFQITVALVGSIGLGAIANWILIHWIPFTHLVWSNLLEFINLPDITAQEKNALTAVAFFLPMAISTIWVRSASQSSKELRIRIYATIVGFIFFVVIGQGVVDDLAKILKEGGLFTSNIFTVSGVVIFISIFISIFTIMVNIVVVMSKEKQGKIKSNLMYYVGREMKRYQIYILAPLFTILLIAAIYVARELGFIRAFSPLFILISLFITVFLNPSRLLATFGVVLAFLGTSIIYDGVMYSIAYVEVSSRIAP